MDGDAVLGAEGEHVLRRVAVVVGDGEAEGREEHGEDDLGLDERVRLADAVARAGGERQEPGGAGGRRAARARREPLWAELVRVGAPDGLVVVDGQHRDPHRQPPRQPEAAELDVLERHPRQQRRRRVQPQRLLDDHLQLQEKDSHHHDIINGGAQAMPNRSIDRSSGGYHGELGEVVGGRRVVAADGGDLGAGLLLPRRVGGEQHDRPREQQRRRLVAGEEEGLALVDHQLRVVAELAASAAAILLLLLHLRHKHSQQTPPVRRHRRPPLVGDLPAPPYRLHQHRLQLAVEPPDLPPVLARVIPAKYFLIN